MERQELLEVGKKERPIITTVIAKRNKITIDNEVDIYLKKGGKVLYIDFGVRNEKNKTAKERNHESYEKKLIDKK